MSETAGKCACSAAAEIAGQNYLENRDPMLKSRLCAVAVLAFATTLGVGQQPQASVPAPAAASDGCPAPGERRAGPGAGGARNPGASEQRAPQRPPGVPNREDGSSGPPKKRLLIWADTRNG